MKEMQKGWLPSFWNQKSPFSHEFVLWPRKFSSFLISSQSDSWLEVKHVLNWAVCLHQKYSYGKQKVDSNIWQVCMFELQNVKMVSYCCTGLLFIIGQEIPSLLPSCKHTLPPHCRQSILKMLTKRPFGGFIVPLIMSETERANLRLCHATPCRS